jgi:LysM repeat protein
MSVATEFSQSWSAGFAPAPASRPARPGAPANRPRLRLVPPAEGCVPGPRRVAGSRRTTGRVTRPAGLTPVGAESTAPFETDGIGAAQFETRPLRLTRRGVVASVIGLLVAGGLLLLVAYLSAGPTATAPATLPGSVVTVQPGDTLWSIAGQVAPGHDPRRVVEQLREVNHLSSVSLTPGQTLKVG